MLEEGPAEPEEEDRGADRQGDHRGIRYHQMASAEQSGLPVVELNHEHFWFSVFHRFSADANL